MPEALVPVPATPAKAPEGRFHHSGQVAAYASLSAEGAAVAIQRYLTDGQARMLVPMWLEARRVVDHRGDPGASIIWQDVRAEGTVSPTWAYSDAARAAGAEAMLYSSRTRPELSHVVVFAPGCLRLAGPVTPFDG
ncbi:RES family NAD+ phosphorylase [Rhodalgimonas zhirmunskyi]|uniref:RES family NAD+ phosphorylase n=1 Tax=Rhodalgimonas zhirmunskyi TaxID=2964767 RepID=UPI002952952C|nr:RES family NAD+ phosphorylase [Rhodoalgimonas zhirmunskyi]